MSKTVEEKKKAQYGYYKKYSQKLDTIIIRPHKGLKDLAQKKAKKKGLSLSQFIIELIQNA